MPLNVQVRTDAACFDLLGVANSAAFTYLDGDSDTTANRNPNARRKCTTVLNWGSLFGLNER